jgi:DNA-binding NarL/FixJ family response regulator
MKTLQPASRPERIPAGAGVKASILLVDDRPANLLALEAILDPLDQRLVRATSGEEALEKLADEEFAVILMDVRMPVMDGLQATRQILGTAPGPHRPRVLMLTTFDLDEYVYEALRAGASGFVLKDATTAELIHAVKVVAAGDALLAPSVTRRLITEFARRPPASAPRTLPDLTPREREVLIQVARGLSNREIASQLFLGEATIKTYVGNILMKLGCRDRVQAVVAAYEAGVVEPRHHG